MRKLPIQVRDTTVSGGVRSTVSTAELRLAQSRINVEEDNRKAVQAKREIAADSLQKYQLQILDLENNSEVAGELGPLQYLSGLTGAPMDKIINILLLVIIFVFDPLAIALVVTASFAFKQAYKKEEEPVGIITEDFAEEEVEDSYNESQEWEQASLTDLENLEEEPYEIYVSSSQKTSPEEQTEHADWEIVDEEQQLLQTYDTDGDGKIDLSERAAIENKIAQLQQEYQKLLTNPNFSSWKKSKDLQSITQKITNLQNILSKYQADGNDDLVIKYT